MFPKISSPCPLQSIQLPESGNFNCSACKREVHDLSLLSEETRMEFLQSCSGKVCVSYKVKMTAAQLRNTALAGVFVVAANGLALPATAQTANIIEEDIGEFVLMGGVDVPQTRKLEQKTPQNEQSPDDELQLIPIVEEDLEDNVG